jgi:5-methylcytosine-specific restriction endonuclease McrA
VNKRTGSPHPTVAVKRAVISRDGGFCLLALPGCLGEAQTAHHRANRGSGGSRVLNHPANLVAVCTPCNGAAEDAHAIVRLDLIERGLRVEKAATNEATLTRALNTVVEYLDGERYYLVDENTRTHETER